MRIVSSGRVINSSEFYKKKQRRRRVQLILLAIGFLSVLASFIYFVRQEKFLITGVVVEGENVVQKEELVRTAESLLKGYFFWTMPRASIFLYPRRVIKHSLASAFPRLKSVDLALDDSRQLVVAVDERAPFALYCISDCFFLDEEGFIFALAPSFSSGVYFVYVTENPVLNPLGKRFITIEEFKSLSRFMETLTALSIRPSVLDVGDNEYRLTLLESGQIIWRRESDLALIESNLEAFLSDNSIRAQENFLDRILYLDLRTENKVFYKFRD